MTVLAATLTHWTVPALSNEMRLPDREPTDGVKGGTLAVVACRDEFEPASFVLRADADLEDVTVERLFRDVVPQWYDFRYYASELRAKYLAGRFTE